MGNLNGRPRDVDDTSTLLLMACREDAVDDRLLDACREGNIEAVRRCLRKGLDKTELDGSRSVAPLTIASAFNHIELAKFLLEEAGADVNATNEWDQIALHTATSSEMASLLLSKGANIDAQDEYGETPLHNACAHLREDVAWVLLQAGASVNIENRLGELPKAKVMRTIASSRPSPDKLGAGTRIIQDLVRHGARKRDKPSLVDLDDRMRYQYDLPALRFAVNLWVEEQRLGVPLTQIPEEEIAKGLEATKTFVKEFKNSNHIVCRRTICVVGPSTAGKTSLIKSLIENQVCLEHIDDRTIGIDHFGLAFHEPNTASSAVRRTHEVKFSDFAGQDVYQGMHSLFFTRRTLFLICIDLNAYSIALLRCEMLTPDDAKLQHFMNEYVDRIVLSRIRIIFARQPDAEFVFVCTKEDTVSTGPGVDKAEVIAHVNMMLERVMVVVESMQRSAERDHAGLRAAQELVAKPITHLWDARLEKSPKPIVKLLVTDATTALSIQHVRFQLEQLIAGGGRSYETPEKYMLVLKALTRLKETASKLPLHGQLQASFVDVSELITELHREVPGLEDEKAAKSILQTLRDCVDILWYEDMEDAKLQTTVMLDPQLLIEFLRQVINHKHATGVICHAALSGLPYWQELNSDQEAMLAMKRLLQTFRLVHPASGEMAFDSDLIVPAYWKTNPAALWVFGGENLRLNPRGMEEESVSRRVHWEFRFTHFIPETLFDHLVVAGYSPFHPLEVGPDWLLYRDGELAVCRVMISRHWKTHERSLLLEAVLSAEPNLADNHVENLWAIFQRLCESLARVLKEHPGLAVTSFAHSDVDGHLPSLSSVFHAMAKGTMMDKKWMPPKSISSECVQRLMGK